MTIYAHQPTWSDEEITFWIKLWADLTDPVVGFTWEWRVGDMAWLPSTKMQGICVVASQEEVLFLDREGWYDDHLGNPVGSDVRTESCPIPLPSYDVIVAMEKTEAAWSTFYHAIEIEDSKDLAHSWTPFWRKNSSVRTKQYLSRRAC